MSAEYSYLADATLDILNKFKWKKILLIFDGINTAVTESDHQKWIVEIESRFCKIIIYTLTRMI